MKKLIIASAFTLLFATGYGQTLADQIYKTDSTWKAFLNDSKEKSNIAWENMLKRESKKPAVQEIPEFKENPNFVRNSYQSSNPFQNNRRIRISRLADSSEICYSCGFSYGA